MGFRLVPKSVTLNDLEQRTDRYFVSSYRIRWLWQPTTSKWLKSEHIICETKESSCLQYMIHEANAYNTARPYLSNSWASKTLLLTQLIKN